MIGSVGQGRAGADFASQGVEVDTSVRVSRSEGQGSPTEPKFGEVWQKIQSQVGAKEEKPRQVKKTLDKDDFLRLMIMQMKYQDPSKPFEMDKMGAEMAQLSSMEQLQNLNQTMKELVSRDKPMERMAMTGMIGKTVSIDRARFPHTEGASAMLKFEMPADSAQTILTIVDQTGTPIFEQELGPHKKGEGTFSWDGKKANRLSAKSGNYSYRITALNGQGQEIPVRNSGRARVVGVSFDGQKPVLLVGNTSNPEKIFMDSVTSIVDDGGLASQSAMIPGARSLSAAVTGSQAQVGGGQPSVQQPPASAGGNFFTFKKGEGSVPIDPTAISTEDARAIEQYRRQALAEFEKPAREGGGFPNGLDSAE